MISVYMASAIERLTHTYWYWRVFCSIETVWHLSMDSSDPAPNSLTNKSISFVLAIFICWLIRLSCIFVARVLRQSHFDSYKTNGNFDKCEESTTEIKSTLPTKDTLVYNYSWTNILLNSTCTVLKHFMKSYGALETSGASNWRRLYIFIVYISLESSLKSNSRHLGGSLYSSLLTGSQLQPTYMISSPLSGITENVYTDISLATRQIYSCKFTHEALMN